MDTDEIENSTAMTNEGTLKNIQNQYTTLKLGRGRGRPRKVTRISYFFNFALTKKRKKEKRKISCM